MADLFYSADEKILFWVAGYCGSTNDVQGYIDMYTEKRIEFFKLVITPKNKTLLTKKDNELKLKVLDVNTSRRYKHMKCFYLENVKPEQVPKEAFHITGANGWTMWKWLED